MEYATEPSAGSLSMTIKCEPFVKEEPEWGESGAEAPQGALYADHEIKDELVFGPELLQQQVVANPMRNVLVKQEDSALEPPDKIKVECVYTCSRDSIDSCTPSLKQFQLKRCFVRLSRIPLKDLYTYCRTINLKHRYINSQSQETPNLMPQQPHISKSEIPQPFHSRIPPTTLRSSCILLQFVDASEQSEATWISCPACPPAYPPQTSAYYFSRAVLTDCT